MSDRPTANHFAGMFCETFCESISRYSDERELFPPLEIRERARKRVLIVDHGYTGGEGEGEAIILSLVGNAAIRSSLLSYGEHGRERKEESERDRCNNRPSGPSPLEKKRPFVLFVRLSVYPSGSFISRRTHESLWPTQFFIIHPLAHCALTAAISRRSSSLPATLLRNIVCFFSHSLVLPTVRLRRRLSSLNAIDVYSLFGKARWRHLAPCHVYRSTLTLSTFFPSGTQLSFVDRFSFKKARRKKSKFEI